jgi:hypothetical protein
MRRSLVPMIVAALCLAACVGPLTLARTQPSVDSSGRAVPKAASHTILFLSPSVLADVGVVTAAPQQQFFAIPTAVVEKELFGAGWDPVPRPAVVKTFTTHKVALSIRDVTGREGSNLVDVIGSIAPASPADLVFLLNGWQTSWEPMGWSRDDGTRICVLAADMDASLHDRTGKLLWRARAHGRGSDLVDIAVVDHPEVHVNQPQWACASRDECKSCPSSVTDETMRTMAAHLAKVLVKDLSAK